MSIDLTDLERLDSFTEALSRLFWCLMAIAFVGTILGSAGTGLFLLILGSLAFVVRAGLEDFIRSRRVPAEPLVDGAQPITIHRTRGARQATQRSRA